MTASAALIAEYYQRVFGKDLPESIAQPRLRGKKKAPRPKPGAP